MVHELGQKGGISGTYVQSRRKPRQSSFDRRPRRGNRTLDRGPLTRRPAPRRPRPPIHPFGGRRSRSAARYLWQRDFGELPRFVAEPGNREARQQPAVILPQGGPDTPSGPSSSTTSHTATPPDLIKIGVPSPRKPATADPPSRTEWGAAAFLLPTEPIGQGRRSLVHRLFRIRKIERVKIDRSCSPWKTSNAASKKDRDDVRRR
jgi:hypothetical protein